MRLAVAIVLAAGCNRAFGIDDVGPGLDAMPSSTGVIAHYTMDTAPADDACIDDDSGNGHDAECIGDALTLTDGKIASALMFDGAAHLQIPSTGELAQPVAFTFAVWIQYTGDGACPINRLFGTDGGDSWQLCLDGTSMTFFFAGAPTLVVPAFAADEWHHIALASTGQSIVTYLDGLPLGTSAGSLAFDDSPIELGADVDAMGVLTGPLVGALDDVWIFDRALGQVEIQTLMTGVP
jgi:hypothetical protein